MTNNNTMVNQDKQKEQYSHAANKHGVYVITCNNSQEHTCGRGNASLTSIQEEGSDRDADSCCFQYHTATAANFQQSPNDVSKQIACAFVDRTRQPNEVHSWKSRCSGCLNKSNFYWILNFLLLCDLTQFVHNIEM